MAKESKKQIKAQLANEIANRYKVEILNLKSDVMGFRAKYEEERKRRILVESQLSELQEKVEKYEDWNRKLQEFMEMTPEEREKHFAELQTRNKLNEKMTSFMNLFQHLGLYL